MQYVAVIVGEGSRRRIVCIVKCPAVCQFAGGSYSTGEHICHCIACLHTGLADDQDSLDIGIFIHHCHIHDTAGIDDQYHMLIQLADSCQHFLFRLGEVIVTGSCEAVRTFAGVPGKYINGSIAGCLCGQTAAGCLERICTVEIKKRQQCL